MVDSDKLGLGLDDIIQKDRTTNRRTGGGGNRGFRSRGGGGGGGGGGGQRGDNGFRTRGGGGITRTSDTPGGRWKHDLFDDNTNQSGGGGGGGDGGQQRNAGANSTTKLLISNLDYNVTTNDIQELFEDIGVIRVARVHYDESGRSLGTAEVVFERRVDAVTAHKKYNSLNLDGRPMDIRLVGGVDDGPNLQSNRFSSANGGGGGGGRNQRSGFRNNQQNGARDNRPRGGRPQQNGRNGKKEDVSAEDLDAELDAYRAESKQKK